MAQLLLWEEVPKTQGFSPPPSPIETTWTFKEKLYYIFEKLKASVQPDQKGMIGSAENLVTGSGWVLQARP